MVRQVMRIGVITGNNVSGLFRAKGFPYTRIKRFICVQFMMKPESLIISTNIHELML